MDNAVRGCLAGLVATAPMTWTMEAGEELVPRHSRDVLPPKQITERILDKADVRHELNGDQRRGLATAAHYAFGASAGGLLGLAANHSKLPRPIVGAVVGVGVWAVSYLGWLPAAGIRRQATEEPAGRNLQMIAAHLVWGVVAGALLDRLGVNRNR